MKQYFLIIITTLFVMAASAQHKHVVSFNSYNSVGFVAGNLPVAFAAQTENGIKYRNWFIGAGIGFDGYYTKTLPLFGGIKKEFPFKVNSLFCYVNAGKNIIVKDKVVRNSFADISTVGGLYADAGIGYKIRTGKKTAVVFSIGNTVKKIKEIEASTDIGFPYNYVTENEFRRLIFKAGFQF